MTPPREESGSAAAPPAAFPPYAFVSPHWPHPRNDPRGHSYGHPEPEATSFDPARWSESPWYLHSVALFNAGYYWEAHEGWEALWHACGRAGVAAEHLKALIKLAAAGVKVRQGHPRGVAIHAARAQAHIAAVRAATGAATYAGFDLERLDGFARAVEAAADRLTGDPQKPVDVVFERRLELGAFDPRAAP